MITRLSLKGLDERLGLHKFLRIHKSYLVNRANVERLNGNMLLVGPRELPIGSTYRQDVLRHLR